MNVFRRFDARILVLAAALGAASAARAERPDDRLVAASPGPFYGTPDGGEGELVAFDSRVAPALTALAAGERIAVDGWPVSPGVARTMVLTRTEVYAPDARVVAIGPKGETEVPRSTWIFFQGRDVSGSSRVAVALDPDTGVMRGLVSSERGLYELRSPDTWTGGRHQLAAPETRDPNGNPLTWGCEQESLPLAPTEVAPAAFGGREPLAGRTALAAFTKYAVVAIDTDNEFMVTKFSNNTTNATNYIANLFNLMNLIYERDVQVHLLEGYTILRLSTVTDPYTQNSGSNASGAELSEFGNYWSAHYGSVKRMSVAMLSGKQPSAYSASGIAWVGGLCSTGYGYNFNKVFMYTQDTSANDILITAHELGHNFSSPHTHCYADPKPDTCWATETSLPTCFAGTPSCPAPQMYNGVTAAGTLMGYCHLLSGCSTGLVFHPYTISRYLNPGISGASSCMFAGSAVPAGPSVSGILPPTGSTSGGTSVTINGSGFVSGATAAFVDLTGSVSLTSVTFLNAGQLTAVTPLHATGVMDLVVFNPDNSTGTLRSGFTYSAAQPPLPCDFNGDGKPDIVWRHIGTGADSVWLMSGDALSSAASIPSETDQAWQIVGIADFNGDGKPDILWRNNSTGANRIWLMTGTVLSSVVALPTVSDTNWKIIAVADFNGDGQPDILWRHATLGLNSIWLMNGTAQSSAVALPTVSDTNWQIVAVADFNGDGQADLVWRHAVQGVNSIWLISGAALSSTVSLPTVSDTNWQIISVADFNGDGQRDILWRHAVQGLNSIWLMSGTAQSSAVSLPTVNDTNWQIVAVADFNGDGQADLVWRHAVQGVNSLWLISGAAQSSALSLPLVNDTNWKVIAPR